MNKNVHRCSASLLAFVLLAGVAQAQFEGIVESKNITTDETGTAQEFLMTMYIKKDMVRIETKSSVMPGSTMIYRNDLRRIWMINPDDQTYFEISQDEKPAQLYGGGTTAGYSVKRTGKTKTIAGYACEQFIIKRETEETQLWGTKRLKSLVATLSKALGQEATAAEGASAEVMKLGIYPMASTTKLEGHVVESQEVTKVEVRTLNLEPFSIPDGYKKQKTVEMMQEMRQQQEDRK